MTRHNVVELELWTVCQQELTAIQGPLLFSFLNSFLTGGMSWEKLQTGFSASTEQTLEKQGICIYAFIIIFAFLYLYGEIQCKILQEEETKLNYRLHFIIGISKELE